MQESNIFVSFEIFAQDPRINRILDEYNKGYYGKSDEAIQWLLRYLECERYDIRISSRDIYIITKLANNQARRTIKSFKKY